MININNIKYDQDIIDNYENIQTIKSELLNLKKLNLKTAFLLKNEIYKLQSFYCSKIDTCDFVDYNCFSKDIFEIDSHINNNCADVYNKRLLINKNEVANGYKLYDSNENLMPYNDFIDFTELWRNNITCDYNDFYKAYNDNACDEWYKMDEYGEFWYYDYNGTDKNEMKKKCRQQNGEALWVLPYPKEVIIKLLNYICHSKNWMNECVQYINFVCEWIKRKMEQLNPRCHFNNNYTDCLIKFM